MLKWRFPVLNDADFEGEEKESILSQLSIKLSKSRKELENILADLQRY